MDVSEINLNADASQFEITKREEQRAFNYYKEKLLPEDVRAFNSEVSYRAAYSRDYSVGVVTVQDVVNRMRKTQHGPASGITGTQIKYVAEIPQKVQRDKIFFTLEMSREKVGMVTLRTWHTFANITIKTELKENIEGRPTIDDYRISPKEEAEALAYIKKFLVQEAVQFFDENKASYGRRHNDVVDPRRVARNLKKRQHFHAGEPGNPVDEADYILYEGYDSTEDFWPPTPFEFVITKDHDEYGWIYLAAGYKNPLRKGNTITTMVKKTKKYPIREGRFRRRQQMISIPLLSKREKDEAFYKLKLIILPRAVNDMNSYLFGTKGKDTPQITVDEALKYLKKMFDNDNRVVYKAEIPGKGAIVLFTEKKNSEFVMHKFGKSTVYIGYNSGGITQFPHEFAMDDLKPTLEEYAIPSYLDDRVPEPVTRKEELMCLNLLKNHYKKEFPEIGKYLKKTGVIPSTHPENATDKLQYEYNDGKKRALFAINRTAAGLWILMWDWGDERARDHLHVNVLGQSHHIKEMFEAEDQEGSQYLDKREIHQAMDYIKKKLIPVAVKLYMKKKHIDDAKLTADDVTKDLRVTHMRDAVYGSTVFLHSIPKQYDFKFNIVKRRLRGSSRGGPWRVAVSFMLPTNVTPDEKPKSTWFWLNYPEGKAIMNPQDMGLIFES